MLNGGMLKLISPGKRGWTDLVGCGILAVDSVRLVIDRAHNLSSSRAQAGA
jgi:hypothetical protein